MTYNRADHPCPCSGAKAVRVLTVSNTGRRFGECLDCKARLSMPNGDTAWTKTQRTVAQRCPECALPLHSKGTAQGTSYLYCTNGHNYKRAVGTRDLVAYVPPARQKFTSNDERAAARRAYKRAWDDAHRKSDKPKRQPLPPCPDCSGKLYAYCGGRDNGGICYYYCQVCKAKWQRKAGEYQVSPREYVLRPERKEKPAKAPKPKPVPNQKPVPMPKPVKQSAKPVAKPATIIKQASQPKPAPAPKPARKGQLSLASRLDDLRERRALQQNDLW